MQKAASSPRSPRNPANNNEYATLQAGGGPPAKFSLVRCAHEFSHGTSDAVKFGIRTILTSAAIGLITLGSPCAGAQEEETQPTEECRGDAPSHAEAQSEASTEAQPEAGSDARRRRNRKRRLRHSPKPQARPNPRHRPQSKAEEPRPLEEIVVTARKVTESIQDAPLSVVVLDAEKTDRRAAITKVEELVPYVPNISMSETGIGTNLYVRGIGSGINQGFEQSVGLYIDGIYYGRGQLTRAPFLDIAQVEALRGPQATLLGNNSIAGALNLTTAKPTDTFMPPRTVSMNPTTTSRKSTASFPGRSPTGCPPGWPAATGPWTATRTTSPSSRDEPNREEKSGRLTLAWNGDTWDADPEARKEQLRREGPADRDHPGARHRPTDAVTDELTSQTGFSRNSGSAQDTGSSATGGPVTPISNISARFSATPRRFPGYSIADTDYLAADPSIGNGTLDYNARLQRRFQQQRHRRRRSDPELGAGRLQPDLDYRLPEVQRTRRSATATSPARRSSACSRRRDYDQWSQELRIASPTDGPRALAGRRLLPGRRP